MCHIVKYFVNIYYRYLRSHLISTQWTVKRSGYIPRIHKIPIFWNIEMFPVKVILRYVIILGELVFYLISSVIPTVTCHWSKNSFESFWCLFEVFPCGICLSQLVYLGSKGEKKLYCQRNSVSKGTSNLQGFKLILVVIDLKLGFLDFTRSQSKGIRRLLLTIFSVHLLICQPWMGRCCLLMNSDDPFMLWFICCRSPFQPRFCS